MNLHCAWLIAAVIFTSISASGAQLVKQFRDGDTIRVIEVSRFHGAEPEETTTLKSIPAIIAEHAPAGTTLYEEVLYPEIQFPARLRAQSTPAIRPIWAGSEVRTLTQQGPNSNRINLTIVGDGYTEAEREKFFTDAERITRDMFTGKTFASYLPLFNVHAVFVPSRESGLSDRVQKDTALGLYRDPPGTKRAIMLGNAEQARHAVSLSPATDYPILIANDDYYGGLGGQYAISTRSELSGTVVLRHELGHNFGDVGEEYDGGQVYRGANFSPNATSPRWKHWVDEGSLRASDAQYLSGEYVWQNLAGSPFRSRFNFPGNAHRFMIAISAVGWKTPDDVNVFLDGKKVNLIGHFTDDRSFFTLELNESLAPGQHTIEFVEAVHDGDNVLAFSNVYALPASYDSEGTAIGAFSVFRAPGMQAGYRPTHASCLMREMDHEFFCAADQENMWIRFLNRITLIDGISREVSMVRLQAPLLPGLEIRWYKVGAEGQATELTQHRDLREWRASATDKGPHRVEVKFRTPEVRAYTPRFDARKDFTL